VETKVVRSLEQYNNVSVPGTVEWLRHDATERIPEHALATSRQVVHEALCSNRQGYHSVGHERGATSWASLSSTDTVGRMAFSIGSTDIRWPSSSRQRHWSGSWRDAQPGRGLLAWHEQVVSREYPCGLDDADASDALVAQPDCTVPL